jgi:branched-subunit amino acid aminotransferase/4-amino-4-deoxychorismate lyase
MGDLDRATGRGDELRVLALVNYGHFTSMRVDQVEVDGVMVGAVKGLDRHLDRLVRDCRLLFDVELDRVGLIERLRNTAAGRTGSYTIRVTVHDPGIDPGRPDRAAGPQLLVTTRPAAPGEPPPLRVAVHRYHREVAKVKHVGLFATVYHRRRAQQSGFDDVLFADADGLIAEGATWNVGFVDRHGTVIWPEAEVLPGVTMGLLQDAVEHTVAPVSVDALPLMAAAFATSTSIGVRPIAAVDGTTFDVENATLRRLARAYDAIVPDRLG